MRNSRRLLKGAALLGASAVILGAFGAHALESRVSEQTIEVWHTANRYHFVHTLGFFGLGLWEGTGGSGTRLAVWGWALGLTLFSGSLYVYALSGLKFFAMLAPLGGICLALGWLGLGKLAR